VAADVENEPKVEHFSGSTLKLNKDGDRVLTSTLEVDEGEELIGSAGQSERVEASQGTEDEVNPEDIETSPEQRNVEEGKEPSGEGGESPTPQQALGSPPNSADRADSAEGTESPEQSRGESSEQSSSQGDSSSDVQRVIDSFTKPELEQEATKRGVSTSGTKEDIARRLLASGWRPPSSD
jgi:hypothetical protein